ncbi:Fork head domain-containing protein FD4 [Eumeta japonica]|uniref:Fork head domain-containing protein FD4 n=1 Tax=Eumeta variegata TaxID=151549 RepID=A0A4C1VUA8_EUMVA|nr:Fork head domain-containing protein FD4 [Eumeta japonica]
MMPRPTRESYGDQKPPFSYIALTAMAIWSSPERMLPLSEIYRFITERFPVLRQQTRSWQNSLRATTCPSTTAARERCAPRPARQGAHWTLHPHAFDMFENGLPLRRCKRFKLHKGEKDELNAELAALAHFNRAFLARQAAATAESPTLSAPTSSISAPAPGHTLAPVERPRRAFTIDALLQPDAEPALPPPAPRPPLTPPHPQCPLPLPLPAAPYLLAAHRYRAQLLADLHQSCLPPLWTWRDSGQLTHYTLNS